MKSFPPLYLFMRQRVCVPRFLLMNHHPEAPRGVAFPLILGGQHEDHLTHMGIHSPTGNEAQGEEWLSRVAQVGFQGGSDHCPQAQEVQPEGREKGIPTRCPSWSLRDGFPSTCSPLCGLSGS